MFYLRNRLAISRVVRTSGAGLLLFLLVSCAAREAEHALFYPVDSLLIYQVHRLTEAKASLDKTAFMGDEKSNVKYVPDSTAWKKELEIFHQINMINKPVNRGLYKVSQVAAAQDNLALLSFEATDDLPVEYLKVYYDGTLHHVKMLEARLREENSMYQASRVLTINFQPHKNDLLISQYSVKGGQKMFLGDSVQYNITGNISVSD